MNSIAVRHYEIALPTLPESFAGYRLLHLSDIHLGRGKDQTSEILTAVAEQSADVLVMTGDILHSADHLERLPGFLGDLGRAAHVTDGIFGVYGNHDLALRKRNYRKCPVRWLDNSAFRLRRGDDTLALIGLNQKGWWRTSYLDALNDVEPDDVKIVLAHYPSTAYLLNGIVDLVLSGHTHAGQIRLPGLPFSTNDDIDCRNARGLSHIGKTPLVVSAGIGYSGPVSIRFFAPPEIGLIELQRTI